MNLRFHTWLFNFIAYYYRWFFKGQAKGYTKSLEKYEKNLVIPEGGKVLDIGCGTGAFGYAFKIRGYDVQGIDIAKKMVKHAKRKELLCEHGNILEGLRFTDNSFDLIVSNMVIQDLANFEKAFQEMYRLLVDGGCFIFSILHPCFVTPESGWEKTKDGKKLHWNVDKYFYEGAYEQGLGDKEKMLFFHRTLTSYINTLIKTGFILESIVEPKPSTEMLKKHPSFEEDFRCADFIVFKLKK